ncbi:unnamed protein product [Clavelina lepadiformis]|uniref:Uncharacterized protein n=1 Tax=Clavelina lepadiformis TaxID=159417 RepID=A0ABP0FPV3_CLALP
MVNPYLASNGFAIYSMTTIVSWPFPTFPLLWTGLTTEIAGGPGSKDLAPKSTHQMAERATASWKF